MLDDKDWLPLAEKNEHDNGSEKKRVNGELYEKLQEEKLHQRRPRRNKGSRETVLMKRTPSFPTWNTHKVFQGKEGCKQKRKM